MSPLTTSPPSRSPMNLAEQAIFATIMVILSLLSQIRANIAGLISFFAGAGFSMLFVLLLFGVTGVYVFRVIRSCTKRRRRRTDLVVEVEVEVWSRPHRYADANTQTKFPARSTRVCEV
ncbi:hypothetical protein CPB83DRAFT_849091, partial [Crepidotus variabilis]